jgi:hypothetical protein
VEFPCGKPITGQTRTEVPERYLTARNVIGFYASCCDGVFLTYLEASYDFGVGHGGVEEGVVYHFGEAREGDADYGFAAAIGLGESAFHVES